MGSCYFHLVFASFWVSLHISSRFNVGWEPSMQDDAQSLRPGADACVEQVWNGGGTWPDVPGIPGILWRVWWSSEFTMGYGEMFFLNVFFDCMFLTKMFMVIVFGACHVLKKPRQRHHWSRRSAWPGSQRRHCSHFDPFRLTSWNLGVCWRHSKLSQEIMKTKEKKRIKSEDRHMNADPKIEVKLLRSQSGQVIFLETGRDFVELLFAIMNAPLSCLLSNSSSKGVQNDLHPFLDLKESLQNLGPQSFASGKDGAAFIPKTCTTKELRDWAKEKAKASSNPKEHQIVPYYGRVQSQKDHSLGPLGPFILKDNCKFMVTDSLKVLESSTITALDLMKDHVEDFRSIKTSAQAVTPKILRKLVLRSMLGSKTVLTDIFPDGLESDDDWWTVDPPDKRPRTRES